MKKKVVIGAGLAGLYFAIKAVKEGMRNVVVYDPRAGKYNRPGHLNDSVFRKAEEGIGKRFWPREKVGHIKDLERALYAEAIRLGIKIENKRFMRLHEDAKTPGVVVDSEGIEEIIEADYVFDCTGARREVVAAVNHIIPDSPLKMETITELPVRNHFLAYVKMSPTDWAELDMATSFPADHIDALSYARSIVKLKALGWNEFKHPRCYGREFGKDKVCLYLHAPDGLTKENYDLWVQSVLECYTSPISYQHLLPPKPKPRFMAFTVKAEALKQVSYKGKNLPTMVALGDAQIDFDYALGHGILDGMDRIDALFEHMEILNGRICYFDQDEYLATIHELLQEHKHEVTDAADTLRRSFSRALETAQLNFRQALMQSDDDHEKAIFADILKEIEARQSHEKAKQLFAECHDTAHHLKQPLAAIDSTIAKLNHIHSDLLKAHAGLPPTFTTERNNTEDLLVHLALSWKEIGNVLFKSKKTSEAIDAYKMAVEIYNLPGFAGVHRLKEVPIYSNLAIAYLAEKRYPETIAAANTALEIAAGCPDESVPTTLKEKIVFNLLKAMCTQAQEFLALKNREEAHSLHIQAQHLMTTHDRALSSPNHELISTFITGLQQQLTDIQDSARSDTESLALQNFGTFATPRKRPEDTTTRRETPYYGIMG